jgi:hypothetical protein
MKKGEMVKEREIQKRERLIKSGSPILPQAGKQAHVNQVLILCCRYRCGETPV